MLMAAVLLAGATAAHAGWGRWRHVHSQGFEAVRYEPETRTMALRFTGGELIEYYEVPEDIFTGFVKAADHGAFFARKVRKAFAHRRLEPESGGLVPAE